MRVCAGLTDALRAQPHGARSLLRVGHQALGSWALPPCASPDPEAGVSARTLLSPSPSQLPPPPPAALCGSGAERSQVLPGRALSPVAQPVWLVLPSPGPVLCSPPALPQGLCSQVLAKPPGCRTLRLRREGEGGHADQEAARPSDDSVTRCLRLPRRTPRTRTSECHPGAPQRGPRLQTHSP